jgi:hypothetical protein
LEGRVSNAPEQYIEIAKRDEKQRDGYEAAPQPEQYLLPAPKHDFDKVIGLGFFHGPPLDSRIKWYTIVIMTRVNLVACSSIMTRPVLKIGNCSPPRRYRVKSRSSGGVERWRLECVLQGLECGLAV